MTVSSPRPRRPRCLQFRGVAAACCAAGAARMRRRAVRRTGRNYGRGGRNRGCGTAGGRVCCWPASTSTPASPPRRNTRWKAVWRRPDLTAVSPADRTEAIALLREIKAALATDLVGAAGSEAVAARDAPAAMPEGASRLGDVIAEIPFDSGTNWPGQAEFRDGIVRWTHEGGGWGKELARVSEPATVTLRGRTIGNPDVTWGFSVSGDPGDSLGKVSVEVSLDGRGRVVVRSRKHSGTKRPDQGPLTQFTVPDYDRFSAATDGPFHTLSAEVDGNEFHVSVDGRPVGPPGPVCAPGGAGNVVRQSWRSCGEDHRGIRSPLRPSLE